MKKAREKEKPSGNSDHSSLLVFGYSCKIFRDDEKAISIERGENLIPWMGDSSLMIDRYDGRGHLYNVNAYDPAHTSFTASEMDDVERVEEEMCEEERWRALHKDDQEEQWKEEEEQKRGWNNSGQIAFSYDQPAPEAPPVQGPEPPEQPTEDRANEDDGDVYVPPAELRVPPNMAIPPNNKLYSVILKTAKFLSNQGSQMEILLKAKQANNPAFQFLEAANPLHTFYRHLSFMIKTKQYTPEEPSKEELLQNRLPDQDHSSGMQVKIPKIEYKDRGDCSYAQLISRIKSVAPTYPTQQQQQESAEEERLASESQKSEEGKQTPDEEGVQKADSEAPAEDKAADQEDADPKLTIPPVHLQTIIDKMASYVSRNGRSFEDIVRAKDSVRFSFLSPSDKHHSYYLHKLNIYTTGKVDDLVPAEPLAFKLKKPESKETVLQTPSALPYEESEDEEENDEEADQSEDNEVGPQLPENIQNSYYGPQPYMHPVGPQLPQSTTQTVVEARPQLYQEVEERKKQEEEKRKQVVTGKLRNKLAAAARGKMIVCAKEKALQLERKKKAAQFLAQLAEKGVTVSSSEPVPDDESPSAVQSAAVKKRRKVEKKDKPTHQNGKSRNAGIDAEELTYDPDSPTEDATEGRLCPDKEEPLSDRLAGRGTLPRSRASQDSENSLNGGSELSELCPPPPTIAKWHPSRDESSSPVDNLQKYDLMSALVGDGDGDHRATDSDSDSRQSTKEDEDEVTDDKKEPADEDTTSEESESEMEDGELSDPDGQSQETITINDSDSSNTVEGRDRESQRHKHRRHRSSSHKKRRKRRRSRSKSRSHRHRTKRRRSRSHRRKKDKHRHKRRRSRSRSVDSDVDKALSEHSLSPRRKRSKTTTSKKKKKKKSSHKDRRHGDDGGSSRRGGSKHRRSKRDRGSERRRESSTESSEDDVVIEERSADSEERDRLLDMCQDIPEGVAKVKIRRRRGSSASVSSASTLVRDNEPQGQASSRPQSLLSTKENTPDSTSENSQKKFQSSLGSLQPTVNKMTEDLRAKVRAMLESKSMQF